MPAVYKDVQEHHIIGADVSAPYMFYPIKSHIWSGKIRSP